MFFTMLDLNKKQLALFGLAITVGVIAVFFFQFLPSQAQEEKYIYLPNIACADCSSSPAETPEPPVAETSTAAPTTIPTETATQTPVPPNTSTPTAPPTSTATITATNEPTPTPTATSTPTPTAEGFIYYASGNEIKDIYKIRMDGTEKQKLTNFGDTLAEYDKNYFQTISHSPTREELVIATKSELMLIDADGNLVMTLLSFESERIQVIDRQISWSSTGDQLAFVASKCSEGTEFPCTGFGGGGLYIVDRTGENLTLLFEMSRTSNSSRAIWGANDRHIWVNSTRLITKVSVPDGESTTFTDTFYSELPNSFDISANEQRAAWTHGYSELYTFDLDIDSPDLRQNDLDWDYFDSFDYIKNTGPYFTNVVWAPSGDKIAFTGVIDNTTLGPAMPIYLSDSDGNNFRKLTSRPEERREFLVAWLDNGKVLFNSEHDGGFNKADVMLINEDGTSEVNLTNTPDVDDIALFVTP